MMGLRNRRHILHRSHYSLPVATSAGVLTACGGPLAGASLLISCFVDVNALDR